MYKRIKYIAIVAFVCSFMNANSQNAINSVYSRYGLGQLSEGNSTRSKSMGGLNLGMRSDHYVNYKNPASLTAIDSMSFFFDLGFTAEFKKTEAAEGSRTNHDVNWNYFTMGAPIKSWWGSAVGLVPFSNIGYNITKKGANVTESYVGSGGINKFFWGNSFELFKGFSIGANMYVLFGDIHIENKLEPLLSSRAVRTDEINTRYRHIGYDLAVQYYTDLNDKYKLTAGVVYEPKMNINAVKDLKIISDRINLPVFSKDVFDGDIVMPARYAAGFTVQSPSLILGLDLQTQMWSKTDYFNDDKQNFENSFLVAAGLEWIPNYRSFNYLNRVRYRFGTSYNKSYLKIDGEQINDYSASVGLGLPIGKGKTTLNIGSEFGSRGTTDNGLVKESYINLSIGLTLHNIWFHKRKFD